MQAQQATPQNVRQEAAIDGQDRRPAPAYTPAPQPHIQSRPLQPQPVQQQPVQQQPIQPQPQPVQPQQTPQAQPQSSAQDVLRATASLDQAAEIRRALAKRLSDVICIPRHVLEKSKSLTDSDLIQIIKKVSSKHRAMIAQRREVSDAVSDALVQFLEEDVVQVLLKNKGAAFSETALQRILTVSRQHKDYIKLLIKREELRPSHGLTLQLRLA